MNTSDFRRKLNWMLEERFVTFEDIQNIQEYILQLDPIQLKKDLLELRRWRKSFDCIKLIDPENTGEYVVDTSRTSRNTGRR